MSLVLYVEPAQALRTACCSVVRERDLEARAVETVTEALSVIAEARPTLVLSALELADFPAASLVAAVRSSPYHRAIPLAAVTSRDATDPQVTAIRFDAVLHKRKDLPGQLDRVLEAFGLCRPDRLRARVLVVDDAAVSRLLHAKLLHAAGAEVAVARDGVEALDLCSRDRFDLVLMDVEMPRLDGREAVRALRQRGLRIPILALTGHQEPSEHASLVDAGFDGVLTKQTSRVSLIERCIRALRERRAA